MRTVQLTERLRSWWTPERLNIRLHWFPPGSINAYLLAGAIVAAGLAGGIAVPEWVNGTHFITLFPSVIVASLLCGVRAGTFATACSAAGAQYFLIPPFYSMEIEDPGDIAGLAGFVIVAQAVVFLIGALRRALDNIEAANATLAALFEANPDAVLVLTGDARIVAANKRALQYFELTREEILGSPLDKVFVAPPGAPDLAQAGLRQDGAAQVARGRRRIGGEFPVAAQFGSFRRGEDRMGILTLRDLTEERATLEALATYALPDALFIHDRDGKLIQVNARACESTGYRRDQLLSMELRDIQLDFDPAAARTLWNCLEVGVRRTIYAHHRRRDGKVFPVEVSLGLMDTPRGLYVAVARDISEREADQERIRQLQKMEGLGQLASGVAHDFNNILAAIVTNLELLQMQPDLSRMARQLQENALAAAIAGSSLPKQLLVFARRQALQVEPADVNEIVSRMADLLRRTLGSAVEVEVRLAQDIWPVLTDRGQLENVLLNLAVNARDALPDGGRLIVATANRRPSGSAGDSDRPLVGDYVELSVADTGVGMAPDVLERAREPFFTTKPPGGGTGLGLSMAENFIQESKGHLLIESRLGKGTTVSLLLPRAAGQTPVLVDAASAPAAAPGQATILVVEDVTELREATCLAIASLGYRVLEAGNAAEALALIAKQSDIDLVFTDISMPGGQQGNELALEIRSRIPRIKIVLTTGNIGRQPIGTVSGGDFTMIPKPYRIRDVSRILAEALAP